MKAAITTPVLDVIPSRLTLGVCWVRLVSLAIPACLGLASACAPEHVPEAERGVVLGEPGKADFVASALVWGTPEIPVCWEADAGAPGLDAERAWVEDAIRSTWSAVSAVRLVGWGACEPSAPGIHIGTTDWAPHTLGLGTSLDGVDYGMRLNFLFESWSPNCQTTREFCVRAGAVHEVGHALGFAHEHGRADTPGWCAREEGAYGDFSFTDWDLDSIMNYCNPEWTGDGDLSESDVIAARGLYGRMPGTIVVGRSAEATGPGSMALAPEWMFAEDATLAALGEAAVILVGEVTGDGREDVVLFDPGAGSFFVIESAGDHYLPARSLAVFPGPDLGGPLVPLLGDLDGDGRDDAITVGPDGDWTRALSSGDGLETPEWIGATPPGGLPLVADVDGDGRDDALVVDPSTGDWVFARSVGTGLAAPVLVATDHGRGATGHFARDVTGDGRADLVTTYAAGGRWWVATANEGHGDGEVTFSSAVLFTEGHGALASARLLTDLDGDGRADALAFERESGTWFSRPSTGSAFGADIVLARHFGTSLPRTQPAIRVGDVDGDGDDDVLLFW